MSEIPPGHVGYAGTLAGQYTAKLEAEIRELKAALSQPSVEEDELETEIQRAITRFMNGALPDDERKGPLRKLLSRAILAKYYVIEK